MEGTPAGPVIVCGLSDLGFRIVEQLHLAGETVVVVDDRPDPRLLPIVRQLGIRHLAAGGRRSGVLEAAGLDRAAALVCAADSDLDNLEIALLARRLRPDVRVVVQLGNAAVGRAVGGVIGSDRVLDVASLAAPTLAESCLDVRSRELDIDGERFVLEEVDAARSATLRELYGDLAPVAVVESSTGTIEVCPGRDHPVNAGDRVVLVGAAAGDATSTAEPDHAVHRTGPVAVVRRYVTGFLYETDLSLRLTLAVLALVAIVSVVILRLGYAPNGGRSMSVLDALYFTTETLTTVGFGDFFFADQPTWLRVWAIVLMILGATLVTVVYALLTNLLVSRRLAQSLGRQLAVRMTDHVVLVGLGSVGLRVLEHLLAAGQDVVVLERDEENRFLARARALRVPVVFGDSTVPASLDAVNLIEARAVAVLTSNDLANIETGLAVTDLLGERRDDVPVVLRVFDRDLAQTIETGFGFTHVRSTAALAAPWFVGAALGLDIHSTFYVDRQPMLIAQLTVSDTGGLAGRPMADLGARIRVIAIHRSGAARLEYPPRRDTRFAGGDRAYLVGPYEQLLHLLRADQRAMG